MALDAIKKIAINFAVVFIIASVFSSVAPGTAQKALAFVEDKLGFGEPSIGYFTVKVDEKDSTQFVVKYGILVNYGDVERVLGNYGDVERVFVSRSYGKTADAKMSDRFKLGTLSLESANAAKDLNDYKGKIDGTVKIEDERDEKDENDDISVGGVHRFTIEVFLSNGKVDSRDAQIMIYDDAYIELFKGGVQGCVTKGLGKDPLSLKNCDVDAQKRDKLEALSSIGASPFRDAVIAAYNMAADSGKVDRAKCKYESSGWWPFAKYGLTEGCSPEEVDSVWYGFLSIWVKKYYPKGDFTDVYYCTKPSYDTSGGAVSVCAVKRQVVMTLNKLGWTDLRERKGWEAGV